MNNGVTAILMLVYLAVIVFELAAMWMVYSKANQPGWGCIIPIYNIYLQLKIVGRPGWWTILYFVPLVSFIIYIIVMLDLARSFGRGSGFGVGLIFLPFIFFPILGFGDAQYVGPVAGQPAYVGAPSM